MQKDSKEFLYKLLETPSPSGFEQEIQKVVKKRAAKFADELSIDVHGNLIACYNPGAPIRVMLAGHCDQIGLMVKHIDSKGYITFGAIGGIDPAVMPGTELYILTDNGPIPGVVGHPPIHLLTERERGAAKSLDKMWIDIGSNDSKEVKKIVSVGDPIVYSLGVTELQGTRIASPGCDDVVGVYVVMEAMRIVASKTKGKKKKFPVSLYSVSTVQEEVGLRGANTSSFGIDPHVGIAVDVTHATDNPGADAKKVGTVNLGDGPTIARGANINPNLERMLREASRLKKIPTQLLAAPRATGTDANVMQLNRSGVATALIGIPNRYMHSQVEVVDLKDLDNAAKLIAETILKISKKSSFIPS